MTRLDYEASSARVETSILEHVSFARADLRGADECEFIDAKFDGARLTRDQAQTMTLSELQLELIDWREPGEEPAGG